MPQVRVAGDGTAEHEGKIYEFPTALAGAVVTIDEDTPTGPPPPAEPPKDERPTRSSSKAEWVDYAVDTHGADRDTAESMTKQDLIDAYLGGEA